MGFIEPDAYYERITCIDVQRDLVSLGIDCILLDIDNTIRSRVTHGVPEDVLAWLDEVRRAGVFVCLLSNNWHSDVRTFADELGLPLVAKAVKPLPHAYFRALRLVGAKAVNTVAVGDQLTTDVWGAHVLGMRAYLVVPLENVDIRVTAITRAIEKRLLSGLVPKSLDESVQ